MLTAIIIILVFQCIVLALIYGMAVKHHPSIFSIDDDEPPPKKSPHNFREDYKEGIDNIECNECSECGAWFFGLEHREICKICDNQVKMADRLKKLKEEWMEEDENEDK